MINAIKCFIPQFSQKLSLDTVTLPGGIIIFIIIYLIAYANILTVRTYVLKTRTYDKMQTEIFKVGPNYL